MSIKALIGVQAEEQIEHKGEERNIKQVLPKIEIN